ncbi:hypothetical protein EGR_03315 [Echinococcus granulosus]|uniref:Uncharacterized protein n=1 Tax=Echinococcus granulosus TaxID=6210 RepID=W6V5X1_ECHGR|nr:hypothetical protein EGR_03315 [Echinococcus granulosus]EUB61769.1 hypothetical protein EGR_03315 [Echinococcus granulosus]
MRSSFLNQSTFPVRHKPSMTSTFAAQKKLLIEGIFRNSFFRTKSRLRNGNFSLKVTNHYFLKKKKYQILLVIKSFINSGLMHSHNRMNSRAFEMG